MDGVVPNFALTNFMLYIAMKTARFTISSNSEICFDILPLSIECFSALYPDVNIVICHNGLNETQRDRIESFGNTLDQKDYEKSLPIKPDAEKWKLYPPRLDLDSHELFIDSDIVITEHIEAIDDFFSSDVTLVYEGVNYLCGQYTPTVPHGFKINSGIFGVPPGYDFSKHLINLMEKFSDQWECRFDDQGLIGGTLPYYENFVIVEQEEVPCLDNRFNHLPLRKGFHLKKGYHFISTKRSYFWDEFNKLKLFI